MIPEKIRQRQRAELAAIHRLDAAGYPQFRRNARPASL